MTTEILVADSMQEKDTDKGTFNYIKFKGQDKDWKINNKVWESSSGILNEVDGVAFSVNFDEYKGHAFISKIEKSMNQLANQAAEKVAVQNEQSPIHNDLRNKTLNTYIMGMFSVWANHPEELKESWKDKLVYDFYKLTGTEVQNTPADAPSKEEKAPKAKPKETIDVMNNEVFSKALNKAIDESGIGPEKAKELMQANFNVDSSLKLKTPQEREHLLKLIKEEGEKNANN